MLFSNLQRNIKSDNLIFYNDKVSKFSEDSLSINNLHYISRILQNCCLYFYIPYIDTNFVIPISTIKLTL